MKLDRLDFETLDALHSGGPEKAHTTSEVAKNVFDDENGVRLSNLDSRIRARLNKLAKYGIVIKDDSTSPNKYNLAYQDVVYGRTEMKAEDDLGGDPTTYEIDADKMLFISNDEGITVRGFIPVDEGGLEEYTASAEQPSDKLNDPEWLREQYIEEKNSVQKIAGKIGVEPHYVRRWMHHFGVMQQEIVYKLDDEDWLRQKHLEEGLTPVEISKLLDCSYVTVRNYMLKHGIQVENTADNVWRHSDLRKRLEDAGIWDGTCWLCGKDKDNLEVHRILPACRGGDDHADNLAPLCNDCHLEKVHDEDITTVDMDKTKKILENHPLYN